MDSLSFMDRPELLTVEEMAAADRAAIAAGTPGIALMNVAGEAVAKAYYRLHRNRPVVVLTGPGNNGGDGIVAAGFLKKHGVPVRLAALAPFSALRGDAALAAQDWTGDVETLTADTEIGACAVIDALFGAGLSRDISAPLSALFQRLTAADTPSLAVDVPSGVDGNTGEIRGAALPARHTVSFFRAKPGHFLFPGRGLCGTLEIADIGIPDRVLLEIQPRTFCNMPALWAGALPQLTRESHKYSRGHGLAVSGNAGKTGAIRMAATAALRSGAGLVTVLAPENAVQELAAHLTAVMLQPVPDLGMFSQALADPRRTAVLLGPGAGASGRTVRQVLRALHTNKAVILDADALTAFASEPDRLFLALRRPAVLTPHEGEFRRLFGGALQSARNRLHATRAAAAKAGAVVLRKGPDTLVVSANGTAYINFNAPPHLATAGSGDVLSGIILGLMTAGMPDEKAAAAGAWIHGKAGALCGAGGIAEDFINRIPEAVSSICQ